MPPRHPLPRPPQTQLLGTKLPRGTRSGQVRGARGALLAEAPECPVVVWLCRGSCATRRGCVGWCRTFGASSGGRGVQPDCYTTQTPRRTTPVAQGDKTLTTTAVNRAGASEAAVMLHCGAAAAFFLSSPSAVRPTRTATIPAHPDTCTNPEPIGKLRSNIYV